MKEKILPVIGGTGFRKNRLDGKTAFTEWVYVGGLKKAAKSLAQKGIINQDTGKPFTYGGIQRSARIYALYNPEEARKISNQHLPICRMVGQRELY